MRASRSSTVSSSSSRRNRSYRFALPPARRAGRARTTRCRRLLRISSARGRVHHDGHVFIVGGASSAGQAALYIAGVRCGRDAGGAGQVACGGNVALLGHTLQSARASRFSHKRRSCVRSERSGSRPCTSTSWDRSRSSTPTRSSSSSEVYRRRNAPTGFERESRILPDRTRRRGRRWSRHVVEARTRTAVSRRSRRGFSRATCDTARSTASRQRSARAPWRCNKCTNTSPRSRGAPSAVSASPAAE